LRGSEAFAIFDSPTRRSPMSIVKVFVYAVVLVFSFLLLVVRYVAA
jgi:hypothetical protein